MDDTTRGLGPDDDLSGRGDESTRNYGSPSDRTGVSRPSPVRAGDTARTAGSSADQDLDPDSARRAREI